MSTPKLPPSKSGSAQFLDFIYVNYICEVYVFIYLKLLASYITIKLSSLIISDK